VKTLDKDLIAIEADFKSRFSLFNFKIWIWKKKDIIFSIFKICNIIRLRCTVKKHTHTSIQVLQAVRQIWTPHTYQFFHIKNFLLSVKTCGKIKAVSYLVWQLLINDKNRYLICSVRLYLELFVGGSCVIYVICVYLCIVVSNTYCVVFLFCFYSSCVPHVASFSFLIASSVFSNVYLVRNTHIWNNFNQVCP
jgi:hypothetical protein